jgi:hypothetical protein
VNSWAAEKMIVRHSPRVRRLTLGGDKSYDAASFVADMRALSDADVDRERKTMMRLWAKREEQIHGVVASAAGQYATCKGFAGRSILEIDGLELPLLDGPTTADAAE